MVDLGGWVLCDGVHVISTSWWTRVDEYCVMGTCHQYLMVDLGG